MKNNISKCIILLMAACFLVACGGAERMNPVQYMAMVDNPEGDYQQQRDMGGNRFSLKYEPVSYKALKELSVQQWTEPAYRSNCKELDSLLYFVFRIEAPEKSKSPINKLMNSPEMQAKVGQYIQSELQKDFTIEVDGKAYSCVLFHFEEDRSLTNYNLVALAFDAPLPQNADLTLTYNDRLFENGPVKFSISKNTINHTPTLQFAL